MNWKTEMDELRIFLNKRKLSYFQIKLILREYCDMINAKTIHITIKALEEKKNGN